MTSLPVLELRAAFGDRLLENVSLGHYTSARLGGMADVVLTAKSSDDLRMMAAYLSHRDIPFVILGGGSNVLVSDAGVRGVVVLNRARKVRFDEKSSPPTVWAESGANLGRVARLAAARGLAGLEWASGIPGTVGGAVFGNAGAHGSDLSNNLKMAEILHLNRMTGEVSAGNITYQSREEPDMEFPIEKWSMEQCGFEYRSSSFKRQHLRAVILAAQLNLEWSTPRAAQAKIKEYTTYRRLTQPPGASMGSMFKNPPGDFAGRMIEEVGLKGTRLGDAQISPVHGNFFINQGNATAADVYALIDLARRKVYDKTGIQLELEIELFGEWEIERTG